MMLTAEPSRCADHGETLAELWLTGIFMDYRESYQFV